MTECEASEANTTNGNDDHRLFRPGRSRGDTVLNYKVDPKSELASYGHAFHEAGRRLVERLMERRRGDFDLYPFSVCPIVFLYRHALELHLKAVIVWGAAILGVRRQPAPDEDFRSHSLKKLLADVRRVFEGVGWGWSWEEAPTPTEFEELVAELDEIDAGSYAFRYPIDRKGESSVPERFSFNVADFAKKLDPILEMLHGADLGLSELRDCVVESAATHD
jgi:hypothetical protein